MLAAGVKVRFGTDNVRDWFFPFGDGDMLDTALFTAVTANVDKDAQLIAGLCDGRTTLVPGEAAERYGISPSVVVIWMQRFEQSGSVAAKPSGGSISPLEQHAEFLLGLIANQPDLTLDEFAAMRKRRIAGSRSAVWRFFARRNISFKKNSVRGGAEACGRSPRTSALDARARHV